MVPRDVINRHNDIGTPQYTLNIKQFSRYGDCHVEEKTSMIAIFNMGIPILVRRYLYTVAAPRFRCNFLGIVRD